MDANGVLTCTITIEWLNSQGSIHRKVSHKGATLRLTRNEFKDMYLEVNPEKTTSIRLKLNGITVHNKFMKEGKASIKFPEDKCTVLLANAAPSQLVGFLRTVFIKMTDQKCSTSNASLRQRLLSNKPKSFEEISPVTVADVDKAKSKVSRSTVTTPSPLSKKRKLERNSDGKAPAAKKLYTDNQVMTEEQERVLKACLSGLNVFFTGSAGTGKSFLLQKIIAALPPNVTIATASTGVAACHIGGITLHQFAGIGRGEATLERSYQMASKRVVAQVWRRTKHLIVDEISMIDADYFEKIENVARYMRKNDKPFGGIQLILCGDFLQLPPVAKNNKTVRFCFQSPIWEKCVQMSYELTQVHRQHDSEFVDILNRLRLGDVPKEIADKLMATSKQQIEQDGILATRLCSHTYEAASINESKLKSLEGEELIFDAIDSDATAAKQLDEQTPVAGRIVLKAKRNETYNIVKEALRMGYRHIDCASFYQNEKEIGKAITECLNDQRLGLKREQLFVTSKLWNTKHRPDCVELACKQSLIDLSLDYLDLYMMHWPMAYKEGKELVPMDSRGKVLYSGVKYVETWQAMEVLVKKSLAKSIAVCNFNKRQIEALLKKATVKPVINQVECHPFLNQSELKTFCNSHEIFITCYSPLGSKDRPWAKRAEPTMLDCHTIVELSKEYKKSPAQIVLRYQFQRNNITIPKTVKKERLYENANIFDFALQDKDMDLINHLNINYRYIELKGDQDHQDYPFHDPF